MTEKSSFVEYKTSKLKSTPGRNIDWLRILIATAAAIVAGVQLTRSDLLVGFGLSGLAWLLFAGLKTPRVWLSAWVVAAAFLTPLIFSGGVPNKIDLHNFVVLCGLWLGLSATAVLISYLWKRKGWWGAAALIPLIGLLVGAATTRSLFTDVERKSVYVAMDDGVQVAVDYYLPRYRSEKLRRPVILSQTRYNRSVILKFPASLIAPSIPKDVERMVGAGYAVVIADVRGTGASEGVWTVPFSDREIKDGSELVDWAARQTWSNGAVGLFGMSYVGSTAEFTAASGRSAVKALVPAFALYDSYDDITYPGGIFLEGFHKSWDVVNKALDSNQVDRLGGKFSAVKSVRPVSADWLGSHLAQIVKTRTHNANTFAIFTAAKTRDTLFNGAPLYKSPDQNIEKFRTLAIPTFSISGWYDGGYPRAALRRFTETYKTGDQLLIGPWSHGGRDIVKPCGEASPKFDLIGQIISFFDHNLKGVHSTVAPVQYYEMCDGWKSSGHALPNSTRTSYFLDADNRMTRTPSAAKPLLVAIHLNQNASSGPSSRWATINNMQNRIAGYPDRLLQDRTLTLFETAPVLTRLDIFGEPSVTLSVSKDTATPDLFVYLEEVTPDHRVRYITEGQLSGRIPPASGVENGASLTIKLLPTSYAVHPGSQLRLAIAGSDRENFSAPSNRNLILSFYISGQASYLSIPHVQ